MGVKHTAFGVTELKIDGNEGILEINFKIFTRILKLLWAKT